MTCYHTLEGPEGCVQSFYHIYGILCDGVNCIEINDRCVGRSSIQPPGVFECFLLIECKISACFFDSDRMMTTGLYALFQVS